MQRIDARHPGLQKIAVAPAGHPLCETLLVDMRDDKAAQHKEHVHREIALVHGSRVAFGVNGREIPAKMKYHDPQRGDAAQRGQRGELLRRSGRPLPFAPAAALRPLSLRGDPSTHLPETGC